MENNPNIVSSRTERKLIERNRRNQMKILYAKLNSLVPHYNSRESMSSLPDQLEEAANYIKRLQTNLERMRQRRDSLLGGVENPVNNIAASSSRNGPRSPLIEIHGTDSSLAIGLTNDRDSRFVFTETIRVLHEEGADIVNASFSVVGNTAFHTIHLTVDHGADACRISGRLNKFIYDTDALRTYVRI